DVGASRDLPADLFRRLDDDGSLRAAGEAGVSSRRREVGGRQLLTCLDGLHRQLATEHGCVDDCPGVYLAGADTYDLVEASGRANYVARRAFLDRSIRREHRHYRTTST